MNDLAELLAHDRFIVVSASANGPRVKAFLESRGKHDVTVTDTIPKALVAADEHAFVLGTFRIREMADILMRNGINPGRIFPYVDEMFAPHFDTSFWKQNKDRLARVRASLADQESKAYFDDAVNFFMFADPRYLTPNPKRRGHYGYDAAGANVRAGDMVIDAGAYTGDTLGEFARASRVYAYEPCSSNFETLKHKNFANVTPIQAALGATVGTTHLVDEGSRSRAHSEGYPVEVRTIDQDNARTPLNYLKIDVEGADLDVLRGARETLRMQRPVVACAAYHTPEHVMAIPEFLMEALAPCRLYASHDPAWHFHIHYIAVPEERAT